MNALVTLYLLKLKGQIRNVFSKPTSAIITVLIILLYGGGFIALLINPDMALTMVNIQDIQSSIMIALGFTALMVGSLLMQKRSALFYENDAFYLFSGPFKRSQVMHYLMSNTLLSSLMFGAIAMFTLVFLGSGIAYSFWFLTICFILLFAISFCFIILKDYTYLLAIQNQKMKYISRTVVIIFIILIGIVYGICLAQHDFDFKNAGTAFLSSDLFYWVPLFGWAKLAMVSFVSGEIQWVLLGGTLVIAGASLVFILMSRYHGDFVEQAMQDAQEFTELYKEIKAGKRTSLKDKKIKNVKAEFKEGARAISSKNYLMMKKTNDVIRLQDVLVLGFYLVLAMIMDAGFVFYGYMLIFWLFASVQNSDFMRDMNYYQIYLIPDKPLKKLWNVIEMTLIKLWIVGSVGILIGGLIFQENWISILQYMLMACGYAFVFVSATVLSMRILKSRSNMMVENVLRMFIILVACIPSIVVTFVYVSNTGFLNMNVLYLVMIVNLAMNFIISFAILYACKGMMNGRELKSE